MTIQAIGLVLHFRIFYKKLLSNERLFVFKYSTPTNTHFAIQSEKQENPQYEIYNILGENLQQGTAETNTSIDVTRLPKGLYFVEIKIKDETLVLRLLK